MKFYKVYGKYFFKRDTFFATISVFIVIGLLGLLPLNTDILNPIKTALDDFEFNDLAYAKLGKNNDTKVDDRIVIVNVGWLGRSEIASLINKINAARPKVIGLDVQFGEPRDPADDSLLRNSLQQSPALVAATNLDWSSDSIEQKGIFGSAVHSFGYVNFIAQDKSTIRYFSPFEKQGNQSYTSFAAAIAKQADEKAYNKLLSRNKEVEPIHYSRKTNKYFVVAGDALLKNQVDPRVFTGKIVLIGYISEKPGDAEDKHFTPMNAQFAGRTLPDMNGIVIHANILSMILDQHYIRKVPGWINWVITIIIAWVHVVLFIRYYIENHIWFHLVAKVAQLISAIFFVYLSIMLFHLFSLKIDIKMPLIVIVLAIDVIYFYEAFALWLNKKFGYRTVFKLNGH